MKLSVYIIVEQSHTTGMMILYEYLVWERWVEESK